MFLSRSSHSEIVQALEKRLADAATSHNQVVQILQSQIEELRAERDFYRGQWAESRGASFTSSEVVDNSGGPSAIERPSAGWEVDTSSSWSVDDRLFFNNWAVQHNLRSEPEAKAEWKRLYGEMTPLEALTV